SRSVRVAGGAGDADVLGAGADLGRPAVVQVHAGVDETADGLRAARADLGARAAVALDQQRGARRLALRPLRLDRQDLVAAGRVVVGADDLDVALFRRERGRRGEVGVGLPVRGDRGL